MARPVWSGAISFGIVNIPVRLVTAAQDKRLKFHQLSGSAQVRVRHRLVAEGEQEELPKDDIKKGYEISPDRYVVVEPEELKQLAAEKSKAIDILDFVSLSEIDPIYYDKPYWVVPDERAGRAYWLLLEAMHASGRVAIARFVMRDKEILAAIRPVEDGLCLATMRYHDEIVALKDAAGPIKHAKPQERELAVAKQIIDSLTTGFQADRYEDEYRKRVLAYLEEKAEGKAVEIPSDKPKHEPKVLDLMAALEASLGQAKQRAKGGGSQESAHRSRPGTAKRGARGQAAQPRSHAHHPHSRKRAS